MFDIVTVSTRKPGKVEGQMVILMCMAKRDREYEKPIEDDQFLPWD